MDSLQFDPEIGLKRHIYNYMVKRNFHESAELFKEEADITIEPSAIDDSQLGFLSDWWGIFWDVYNARPTNLGLQESFIKNIRENKESSAPTCDICKFYEVCPPPAYASQEASSSRTPAECYQCLQLLGMLKLMGELPSLDVNSNNYYVESLPSTYGAMDGESHEFQGTPTRCYDWDELSLIFKPMGESTRVDVNSYNYNVETLPSANGATDGENQECDEPSMMFKPRGESTGSDVNSQNYIVESLPSAEGAPDGETRELKHSDA